MGQTTRFNGMYAMLGVDAGSVVGIGVSTANANGGVLQLKSGITFPSTQVAATDVNTLDDYREGTFVATATGMTTTPTGTATYVRVGNSVNLEIPLVSGTSNATTFTLTGMVAAIRPAAQRDIILRTQDNTGAYVISLATISTGGVITLYASANSAVFTATGTKSVAAINISYVI